MREFSRVLDSTLRALRLAVKRSGVSSADAAHAARHDGVLRGIPMVDDFIEDIVGVSRGKIPSKLVMNVIGMLVEMMKHRAVEDKRFQRGGPLPKYLPKRPPEIKPESLGAELRLMSPSVARHAINGLESIGDKRWKAIKEMSGKALEI